MNIMCQEINNYHKAPQILAAYVGTENIADGRRLGEARNVLVD